MGAGDVADQAMHVRVKRKDTTFFLNVAPTDYVLEVKQRLQDLTERDPSEQQLIKGRAVLDDAKSLAEQRVENDDVIALVFKSGEGEFEPIDIDSFAGAKEGAAEAEHEPAGAGA